MAYSHDTVATILPLAPTLAAAFIISYEQMIAVSTGIMPVSALGIANDMYMRREWDGWSVQVL